MAIKLVSALSTTQHIQFQNSSGVNTGKIEASGDDLVITNSTGNVLFGDLDSNVYIGDGVNSVDILFEQSGAIRSETGSNATITLGSGGTTLNLYNPQIANGASLTSTLSIGAGGVIDFLPDTGAIINLDGQTILKRNTFNGGITLGHDDAVIIAGGDTYNTLESNISLGAETVFLGAEGGVIMYAFPNNDTSWSNRKEFIFSNDTNFYLDGRVYPSDQATNYVDSTRIANWQTAYGWGDHGTEGYLTSVNNGSWSGTDLSIANGGTGASSASAARTNLGLGSAATSNTSAFDAAGSAATALSDAQTWVGEQNYASDSAISTALASYLPLAGGIMTGTLNIGSNTNNGAAIKLIKSTASPEIRIQAGESGVSAFTIYNTATSPDAEQFFINNTLGVSHLGNKRGALKLESSSGVVLTLSGSSATFAGTIAATNFSGSSSGTNTGDQVLPTASSLGAVTLTGTQTITGDKTFSSNALTLKGHMYFNEHSAGRHYIHFKTAGSTNQVDWRIQTNNANTIIHSWSNTNALFRTNLQTTGTVTANGGNSGNWNTAYGWGNHGSAGYLTTSSAASTYAPKASPALTGTPTAPTAAAATNTTQLATTAFVSTAIANLSDSAPATLDTLNELAAALGDDANFSTTVTNSIATKLPKAGGTLTGGLTIDYAAGSNPLLSLFNGSNGNGAKINFSDQSTPSQTGTLMYVHSDGNSYGTGNAFVFSGTESTMNVVALGNLMYRDGIYKTPSSGTGAGTRKDANWDTAYGWGNHASAGYLTSETFGSSDVVLSLSGTDVTAGESITLAGGLSYSGTTLTSANTTYSAGTGLTLTGTTFSVTANTYAAASHTHAAGDITSGTFATARIPSLAASKISSGTLNADRLPRPLSGDWWNGGAVIVGTDGVMEAGKYMDWHDSDTETSDYSYRMTASNSNMTFSGGAIFSGDLQIPANIVHVSDTNTYFGFHANDQWRVVTGGSERLEVNNTQTTVHNKLYAGGDFQTSGSTSVTYGSIATNANGAVVRGGFLNPAAEANMVHLPHVINDFAGFNHWGTISVSGLYKTRGGSSGSYSYSNAVASSDFDNGAAFDAYSSTAGSWYSNNGTDGIYQEGSDTPGVITLEWTNELLYSAWVGIVFGSGSFTATKVKIEAYRGGAWQTLCDLTDNTSNVVLRQIGSNSGTNSATTKVRYTLGGSVNNSYFRIHTLYAANYRAGDNNLANLGTDYTRGISFFERFKNNFAWGNFTPAVDSSYNLGSSGRYWSGVYADKIYLNGTDTNTSSTTALVLNGTEVEKRTLGSNAFNSTSYLGATAKAADSNLLDGIDSSSFLRSDATDTFTGQLVGNRTDENLKVSGIRGQAKGSQTGQYIHLYERVHVGGPNGWGAATHGAPAQGLSTWGSVDFGMNGSGVIQLDGTTIVTSARALTNVTNTNWDTAYGWGNHASGGYSTASGVEDNADVTDTANVVAALTAGTNVQIAANGTISATDTDTVYTHPTSAGNKHIPTGGGAGQFLKYSSSGTATWATPSYTTNTNTQLSNEQVQDIVGAMFSGNTESNITATYQDGDGTIDLSVAANYGSWDLVADDDTTFRVDTTEHVKFQGANISGTGTQADPFLVNTPDTNTTYTADGNYGMTLSGTAFRLENDRRRNSTTQDIHTGNTHDYTFYDASVGIRWYTAGAEEMRLEDDGDLHVDGDVIAFSTTVSDARLKDDVQTIENATEKVNQLRGVSYTWNEGSRKGQREIGVIAQEVQEVVPEVVHEKKLPFVGDETYKTVDYEKLVALLIESNKELTARVEQLEARLDGSTK